MSLPRTAVVIPSLGGPHLSACLEAVAAQSSKPARLVVVLSAGAAAPEVAGEAEYIRVEARLGFAAAVNRGVASVLDECEAVAILNDDAVPGPQWLEVLGRALLESDVTAVQGTVSDGDGRFVDGRGIEFDRWGLPVQVERGRPSADEDRSPEPRMGLSATAILIRASALRRVLLPDGTLFDEAFDSYHEDTDLNLRFRRLGLFLAWIPGAGCRHLGSATGRTLGFRRPWWILTNRWRAVAGNLSGPALIRELPRLLRGEIRALRTLARENPATLLVAPGVAVAVPFIIAKALTRASAGPRLTRVPG